MTNRLTKAQFDAMRKLLAKKGRLKASEVLEEAKNPESKLHSLFEWDDAKAAHEYRLIQSRQAIRRYNFSVENTEDKLAHIGSIRREEGEYKPISMVVRSVSDFDAALSEALGKLKAADRAVNDLMTVANRESPSMAGVLAIALKGLETANAALEKLH